MARRGGLGTNLDALIPTSLTVGDQEVGQQNEVAISSISPGGLKTKMEGGDAR